MESKGNEARLKLARQLKNGKGSQDLTTEQAKLVLDMTPGHSGAKFSRTITVVRSPTEPDHIIGMFMAEPEPGLA